MRSSRRSSRIPDLAVVVRNATKARRRKLLWALVDGWGLEDTLTLIAQAMVKHRARIKRETAQNRRRLARAARAS